MDDWVAPRGPHLLHLLLLLLVLQLQLLHLERLLPLDGRSRVAILPRPVRLLPIPSPRLLLKFGVITVWVSDTRLRLHAGAAVCTLSGSSRSRLHVSCAKVSWTGER